MASRSMAASEPTGAMGGTGPWPRKASRMAPCCSVSVGTPKELLGWLYDFIAVSSSGWGRSSFRLYLAVKAEVRNVKGQKANHDGFVFSSFRAFVFAF